MREYQPVQTLLAEDKEKLAQDPKGGRTKASKTGEFKSEGSWLTVSCADKVRYTLKSGPGVSSQAIVLSLSAVLGE